MGISFARGNDTSSVQPDTVIFDYMKKIMAQIDDYQALYFNTHLLQAQSLKVTQRQELIETFENVVKKSEGESFSLPNEDILFFYKKKCNDEVKACLVKVRFMFHDDPIVRNADDLETAGLVKIFDLARESEEFAQKIKDTIAKAGQALDIAKNAKGISSASVFNTSAKKLRRELTPEMLAKLQKILAVADFSSFIRRQSICAVIGKAPPQRVFEEVYVSIPDLREMLLPDVDLTANPWLFLSLSETLDKRVLETINRHDDGSLSGNFSININVSTILSDEFLEFDENISPSMRSSVILELQLVDIFSDIKAFMLAKNFAQSRGYKICIDGITVDKLKFLNRVHLDCDLLKIIWHPSFMDVVNEDKHFMDYVNKAERAKMILCRIDDSQAVEVGNNLGINLYQGRYIQRMLNAQPKRTIFAIRK